jgi:hypothetical protein
MLFRLSLLSLIILSCTARVAAQEMPRFTLKTNTSTLLHPFKPAIALTSDIRLSQRFSLDVGAGWILDGWPFANQRGESYQGPRLRLGFKYIHSNPQSRSLGFLGVEAKYNDVIHQQWREVGRQGGQYREILMTRRLVKSTGLAYRMGRQFFLGASKRFIIEPYAGLGIALHTVTMNLPEDAIPFPERGMFLFEYPEGRTLLMDMLYGIHIGYAFW